MCSASEAHGPGTQDPPQNAADDNPFSSQRGCISFENRSQESLWNNTQYTLLPAPPQLLTESEAIHSKLAVCDKGNFISKTNSMAVL